MAGGLDLAEGGESGKRMLRESSLRLCPFDIDSAQREQKTWHQKQAAPPAAVSSNVGNLGIFSLATWKRKKEAKGDD